MFFYQLSDWEMISNGEAEIDDPPLPPLLPRKGSYLTKGRFFLGHPVLGKTREDTRVINLFFSNTR